MKTTIKLSHPEDSVKDALENSSKFGQTNTKIATNEAVTEISQDLLKLLNMAA